MSIKTTAVWLVWVSVLACHSSAATVCWSFGSEAPTSNGATNVAAGAISRGNGGTAPLLTDTSPSVGYAGASAGSNAVASAGAGPLSTNDSAFFQFTLTPDTGTVLRLTALTVGVRSTSTGPQALSVRSSLDGYVADLALGTLAPDSVWALKSATPACQSSVPGGPVTFRLYGYSGTGGSSNWRIDDLAVEVAAVAQGTASPPGLTPVAAQAVRLGGTLAFTLQVTPTDGDPVTATNCTADAGVTGTWSLAGGVFRYTPVTGDLGERSFTFTATDKDGTSASRVVGVTVRRAQVPAVRMTAAAGTYVQDFNTLATNGAAVLWDNGAEPLEAWYAYYGAFPSASYGADKGAETAGCVYAYGCEGGSDRALGSLSSDGTGDIRFGVALTNETGAAVTNLTVSYRGEQWRCASNDVQSLTVGYCVTNSVIPFPQGECRWAASLRFDSPHTNDMRGPVTADGRMLTASLPVTVPPGSVVLLCWLDVNASGSDHGLAIDDLTVTWAAAVAPKIPKGFVISLK